MFDLYNLEAKEIIWSLKVGREHYGKAKPIYAAGRFRNIFKKSNCYPRNFLPCKTLNTLTVGLKNHEYKFWHSDRVTSLAHCI